MEGSSFLSQAIGQGGSGGVTPDQDTSTSFQQGGTGQPVNVGITQAEPAPAPPQQPTTPAPAPPRSRLQAILGAVANVVTTGLSAIPDRGRPSAITGLGEGPGQVKTIPSPWLPEQYSRNALSQFQDNIKIAATGLPRLPGVPTVSDIRKQQNSGSNLGRSVMEDASGLVNRLTPSN